MKLFRRELVLNFSSGAAGGLRIELQSAGGQPFTGFTLGDSVETIGDDLERVVRWRDGSDLSRLAGQPVRLRLVMKDTVVYSLRFR